MEVIIWDSLARLQFHNSREDHVFLCTYQAFEVFECFQEAERIFLLAELTWFKNNANQAFYGFEVLKKLRLKQVTCPIIICSFLPKDYFLNQTATIFNLLRLPVSHPFVRLPQNDLLNYKFDQNLEKVSKEQLEDALYHFSNPVGTLDEILHDLKDRINYNPKAAVDKAFADIQLILPIPQHAPLQTIKTQLFQDINKRPKSLSQLVSGYKTSIRNLLPKSQEYEYEYESKKIYAWGALLVDDNADQRQLIKEALNERGVHCLTAGSGKQALTILRKDAEGELKNENGKPLPKNFLTVLICDLRLEDENKNWQPMQGYDILKQVHGYEKNYMSFFVLTSKRRAILSNVSRFSSMQIKWFSKEMILHTGNESNFNAFATQIREDGITMLNAICSFPKAKTWKHPWKKKIEAPLMDYYRVFRLSSDYHIKEKWISDCALSFIEEAELVKDERIKRIHSITNQNFSTTFMSGIKGEPGDPQSMEKFYIKLIGRRIAIGLHLKDWDKEDISDILKFKQLNNNSADRQLFSAYLALSLRIQDEIPAHLLIEERKWIERCLGFTLEPSDKSLFLILKSVLEEVALELRSNKCPDDFVDREIIIDNKRAAQSTLTKAYLLSKEFRAYKFLREKMDMLFDNEHLASSIRKNGIRQLWEYLTNEASST